MTRIRVGIVSWNTAGLLARCLASLPEATAGVDADVVVVDNASSDRSVEVAGSVPAVEVIRNRENLGYAVAMNQALMSGGDASDYQALVALNPDTECPPGSLSSLVSALDSQPDAGLVVPRLLNPDGTPQPSVYRFPSPSVAAAAGLLPLGLQRGPLGRRFGLEAAVPADQPCDIDWAIGAVHVIRPAALGGERPYDERWFMYVEDLDLCWRLARAGWRRWLLPDVRILHVGNAAGAQAWGPDRVRRYLDATYDWYELRHGPAATRRWAAVNLIGGGTRLTLAGVSKAMGRPLEDWQRDLRPALARHWEALAR